MVRLCVGRGGVIALKDVNYNAAAIDALRKFKDMQFIANNTRDEIKEGYEDMTAPRMPTLTGLPSAWDPRAGEDILSERIDTLDILRKRYSTAFNFVMWFTPVWWHLTDTERQILSEFYMTGNQRSGATNRLAESLGYSESHVERLRAKALSRLCLLLYGKS